MMWLTAARPLLSQVAPGALVAVMIFAGCTPQPPRTPVPALQAYRDSIPGTLVSFELVPLPAGAVVLEDAAGSRRVEVEPVWIGRTEVTWNMYDVFALGLDTRSQPAGADATARPSRPYGAPDYGYGHSGYPVISVTRAAAEAFCAWLSARTARTYRLPTEAEWLHAGALAAGGAPLTAARRDAIAWHDSNASGKTHPVASKGADQLGLFDLFGNAAEWVASADGQLVLRGGSYRSPAHDVGPHARTVQDPSWNERDPQLPKSRWWLSDGPFAGFRIVREPDSPR